MVPACTTSTAHSVDAIFVSAQADSKMRDIDEVSEPTVKFRTRCGRIPMVINSRAGIFFSTARIRRNPRVAFSRVSSVATGDINIAMRRGASAIVGLSVFPAQSGSWFVASVKFAFIWVEKVSSLLFFNCCSFFSFLILKAVSVRRRRPSLASIVFLNSPFLWSATSFRNGERNSRNWFAFECERHVNYKELSDESFARRKDAHLPDTLFSCP